MKENTQITLFGSDGYLGSSVLYQLAKTGCKIIVPVMHEHRNGHLKYFSNIHVVQRDPSNIKEITKCIENSSIVINLHEITRPKNHIQHEFNSVNHQFCKYLVQSCIKQKVRHLIHHSVLGLDNIYLANPYWQSKFYGEKALISANNIKVSIVQSSWIYGDGLLIDTGCIIDKIAQKMKGKRFFLLIGSKLQIAPINLDDLTKLFYNIAVSPVPSSHQRYKAVGPDFITLENLILHCKNHLNSGIKVVKVPSFMQKFAIKNKLGTGVLFPTGTKDMNISLAYSGEAKSKNIVVFQGKKSVLNFIENFSQDSPLTDQLSILRKVAKR